MKRTVIITLVMALAASLAPGAVFAADAAEGFWVSWDEKTGKATAGWEIFEDGGRLFGRILSVAGQSQDVIATACKDAYKGFPETGKPSTLKVVGTRWIFGLAREKEGVWSGGNIIDPADGKMYKCRIAFHKADGKKYKSDVLEMRGEIGLGIGRSQFWQKAASRAEASALR